MEVRKNEEDFSTTQQTKKKNTRVQSKDENSGRQKGIIKKESKG